ncbi:MAG TPA: 6,7-dimethyl-8-ribityllumazine synthase [candidate division Zixibacteria bacterium]|nr:6,7-dimethyl-8-ribityllumazine synthase [candidate division Zixibacteria bacterium]
MSYKRIEGHLKADDFKIGIIVSRFNNFFTDKLLEGAIDCLERHGASRDAMTVAWVPGAFEIPFVASKMAKSGKYEAVICLGAVVRGDTPHFDYIANESAKGIAKIGLDTGVPVIYGMVTADTLEQAIERSGTKAGNKGWDAAETAIEMINLNRALA